MAMARANNIDIDSKIEYDNQVRSRKSGKKIHILVKGDGKLFINGVDKTDDYAGKPMDRDLFNALEKKAAAGRFDNVDSSLLRFLDG